LYHHNHRGRAFSLGLLALVILLIGSAHGAIRVVPSPSYPTIQAAINDADPGDTIQVSGGPYNENVVVNVNNLKLEGIGSPEVDGGSSSPASPSTTGLI
jgi:pectin methylesterase-like acyl-CoA thioesterase